MPCGIRRWQSSSKETLSMRHPSRAFLSGCMVAAVGACVLPSSVLAEQAPASTEAAPEPIPFLMKGADAIGIGKLMEDHRIKAYGWVEQSFTFNVASPENRTNSGRLFDDRSNDYRFNQLALNIERTFSDKNEFQIGGKVELMYGNDMRFTQVRGLTLGTDGSMMTSGTDYQFDPVQFYVTSRIPIGEYSLDLKLGRYVTPFGAEVIDGPSNALFSHSYLFNYAIPFTHTGIHGDFKINDKITVYYGACFGWDVFDDQNDNITHMVGAYGNITEKWKYAFNAITGAEGAENDQWRTVFNFLTTYQWTEAFSSSADFVYGFGQSGDQTDTYWWGAAAYATYRFNPQLATTLRGEFFQDRDGTRFLEGNFTEVTFGVDIYPFKKFMNLRVRPEARWDASWGSKAFNGGNSNHQGTLATDVIITF